jgi:hypothetical protein
VVVLWVLNLSGLAIAICSMLSAGYLGWARLLGWQRTALARVMRSELRPLYLPAIACIALTEATNPHWFAALWVAIFLVDWWVTRNDDHDDRWRRRARKAGELVARVGARLQVVPSPSR